VYANGVVARGVVARGVVDEEPAISRDDGYRYDTCWTGDLENGSGSASPE
jgi:hypothetical protein